MTNKPLIDYIENLLALNRTDSAIEELRKVLKDKQESRRIYDEIILHSGRWHSIETDQRKGVVSGEFAGMEKNKIRYALQDLIKDLGKLPDYGYVPEVAVSQPISGVSPVSRPHVNSCDAERIADLEEKVKTLNGRRKELEEWKDLSIGEPLKVAMYEKQLQVLNKQIAGYKEELNSLK